MTKFDAIKQMNIEDLAFFLSMVELGDLNSIPNIKNEDINYYINYLKEEDPNLIDILHELNKNRHDYKEVEDGMTIADLIRNMSDEELAQMMIDIAYENTPIEDGETYMRIPSPIGGYLVDGVIDLHDTDVVVDALQEEVEDGNDD